MHLVWQTFRQWFGWAPDMTPDATLQFEWATDRLSLIMIVGVCLLLITLAVNLYLKTAGLTGRGHARILLSLRLAQVILLALILANPLLALREDKDIRSRLMVLVDRSASMKEKDLAGTTETLKQTAIGIGRIQQVSNAVPESTVAEIKTLSRLEFARRLVARDDGRFWRRLGVRRDLRLAAFASGLEPLSGSPTNGWEQTLTNASGEATFLGSALREAVNQNQGTLTEILLLTDGAANGGIDPLQAALEARAAGVRIFPVTLGAPSGNPDTILLSAAANLLANKGDQVEVIVEISTRGYSGQTTTVELRLGDRVLDRKPVTLQADTHQRVALSFRADRVGGLGLAAVLVPQPNEANRDNNTHLFTVRVVEDKYDVLYVDGYPRWEYRFLKNLLMRDTSLRSRIVLQNEPNQPDPLPDHLKALEKTDVIVLGDISPRFFSRPQLEVLEQFVAKQGGGLILIAGEDFMPTAFRDSPVETLLPVVLPAPGQPSAYRARKDEPFFLELTPEGSSHAAMRLMEDPLANLQAWARMPGHYWCRTLDRMKPGASALAVRSAQPGTTDRLPLIVHMRYGKGQVLYVALDSTWRWRHLWGETHFDRFWGQMIRNLAPERDEGRRQSQIRLSRATCAVGDPVEINALAYETDNRPVQGDGLTISLSTGETNLPPLLLQRGFTLGAGEFKGRWSPPRDGSYLVRIDGPGLIPAAALLRVGPLRSELNETAPDPLLLKQIADLSGGTVFDPAALAKLPDLLPNTRRVTEQQSRQTMWDNWVLFCLLAGANLTELFLRKRWGLL
jgi:hypothetical protein